MSREKHGGSYTSPRNSEAQFLENERIVTKRFPLSPAGYFGTRGKSKDNSVRNIISVDPLETAKSFFRVLGEGGRVFSMPNGRGEIRLFEGGSLVSIREVSSSDGSPSVEVNVKFKESHIAKNQKIHFTKKAEQ
jgi:hypothetical protein